jgi:hypothetical protein
VAELSPNAETVCRARYFIDDKEDWQGLALRQGLGAAITPDEKLHWVDRFSEGLRVGTVPVLIVSFKHRTVLARPSKPVAKDGLQVWLSKGAGTRTSRSLFVSNQITT